MARRVSTDRLAAKYTPLDMDELDRIAGGLTDPDKNQNQDPAQQTTQTADGAAFAQAQDAEPTPEEVQGRFQDLQNDYRGDHEINAMPQAEVALMARDIEAGRLDGQLGQVLDVVRGIDPFKWTATGGDAPEFAQLASALLERYADPDRPASLNGMMVGQERVFRVGYLESAAMMNMAMVDVPGTAQASLELIGASAKAFDAAGRTADADHMDNLFTNQFCDMVENRHVGQEGLVAGLVADGTVSTEQFSRAFAALGTQVVYAYREFQAGLGGDVEAHLDDPAVKVVHDAMVGRLTYEASWPETVAALADTFAAETRALEGLHLDGELETIYAAQATKLAGGQQAFFEEVLRDALEAHESEAEVDELYAWASRSLNAPWQVVDLLFDLPAGSQVEGLISRAFGEALERDPNASKIGALLSEGVVPPGVMIGALVRDYNPATDNPTNFQVLLTAIAKASGAEAAAFTALIPRAVFSALVDEAVDGRLDSTEASLAAKLLVADHSLPVEDLSAAVRPGVFQQVGQQLLVQLNPFSTRPFPSYTPAQILSVAAKLRDFDSAGPTAIAEALTVFMYALSQPSPIAPPVGLQVDMAKAATLAAATPADALAIMVALDSQAKIAADTRFSSRLDAAMAAAITTGSAVDSLAQAVAKGEMTKAQADSLIDALASHGKVTDANLVAWRHLELVGEIVELGSSDPALINELRGQLEGNPSSVVTRLLQLQGQIGGLPGVVGELAVLADAADLDVGQALWRVFLQAGVDVRDVAPAALAGLVATGKLTADEAVDGAGSLFTAAELHFQGSWREILAPIAGAMGVVRLVAAAESLTAGTATGAEQLSELRVDFMTQVEQGTFARAAIGLASQSAMWAPQIIALLNVAADTADVFRGTAFVNVLASLGSTSGGTDAPGYQFRDALRTELYNTLVGDSAMQAGWVASLKEALTNGQRTAAEIVAALETIVENAYARQGLSGDRTYWQSVEKAAVDRQEAVFDGLDRLFVSVGTQLLANATTHQAALDWFRALPPSGQLEMLRLLPSSQADIGLLKEIAAQRLDTMDWTTERVRVETTISVGNYGAGDAHWNALKAAQAAHDLAGAAALAAMVNRSPVEQIVDMAQAWQLITYNSTYNYWTRTYSSTGVQEAVQTFVTGLLKDATARNALAVDLAEAVGAKAATVQEIYTDIKKMIAIGTSDLNPNDRTYLPDYEKPLKDAFSAALTRLGLSSAASDAFMAQVDDGSAFSAIRQGKSLADINAKIVDLENRAKTAGASVEVALVSLLDMGFLNPDSAAYTRGLLAGRLTSGEAFGELLREVGEQSMTMSQALDVLQHDANQANRSFGSMLADMLAVVQTKGTATLDQFIAAVKLDGVTAIITQMGADLQAGRFDGEVVHHYAAGQAYNAGNQPLDAATVDRLAAAEAAKAVYALARATGGNAADALSTLVSAALRADAQHPTAGMQQGAAAAAEAIKFLDNFIADSGNTAQSRSTVAATLETIRTNLASVGESLSTADQDALNVLADLFLQGAVNRGDAAALIDDFDGAVPDRALVTLAERMDAMANTEVNAELRAMVSGMLAQRVAEGETFRDLMPEIEAVYRNASLSFDAKAAAYQSLLDFGERAVVQARFAAYYAEAKLHQGAAAAAAAADALVLQTVALSEATAAYRLFVTAQGNSAGTGFAQWAVNTTGHAVRDEVLTGMFIEMRNMVGPDGTLRDADQARFSSLQATLMEPEMRQVALMQAEAMKLSQPARDAALVHAAGWMSQEVAKVADRAAQQLIDVVNSSAVNAVLFGTQTPSSTAQKIAGEAAPWLVMVGCSYTIPLQTYLIYTASTAADGVALGVAVTTTIVAALMKWDTFRYAIGPGASESIGTMLKAVEIGRSVLVEAATAFVTSKVDAALGVWQGTNDIFESLSSGKVDDLGSGLLKFADNLSSLINVYDMRAQFLSLRAGLEQAVKVLREAATAIAAVISAGYGDLRSRDDAYASQHTLGVSFL